jgi:hypothetical protein
MKRLSISLGILTISLLLAAAASGEDRYWNDHADPHNFLFGNHIDTHQETRLYEHGARTGELRGWFYVFDSGDTLADGTPILKHCTGTDHYGAGCVAGWRMDAKPCIQEVNDCQATFLYHDNDHPVWLLGGRQDIVQPGSYTHFHWLTEGLEGDPSYPSSLSEIEEIFFGEQGIINVPDGCNVAMANKLISGTVCPGYFLQIEVLEPFGYGTWAFHHGGEDLLVRPGIDNKTHLNLLTSFPSP